MPTMPTRNIQWNPYDVLDINKSHTRCCGWARAKGRTCHMPIAMANCLRGQQILSKISEIDPTTGNLSKLLKRLAKKLLCKRWHRYQAKDVVKRWKGNIEKLIQGRRAEVEEEEKEEDREEEEEKEKEECLVQSRQYFHRKCIGEWLRSSYRHTCPCWYTVGILYVVAWLMCML